MKFWEIMFIWPTRNPKKQCECSVKKICAKHRFKAIRMAKDGLIKIYGKQKFELREVFCLS